MPVPIRSAVDRERHASGAVRQPDDRKQALAALVPGGVERQHRLIEPMLLTAAAGRFQVSTMPSLDANTARSPKGDAATLRLAFLADDAAGYVLDSLSLAVAAVMDPRPLVDVLVDIVRIGNDTGTNAAVAGGPLGVRDGRSAVPTACQSLLQFADEFSTAADMLRSQ